MPRRPKWPKFKAIEVERGVWMPYRLIKVKGAEARYERIKMRLTSAKEALRYAAAAEKAR